VISDPIETQLSALRGATHFQAPDPAVVRRRGDRLRRRNGALKVGGAALALTLLAAPLLSLTRPGGTGEPTPAHGLTAADTLSLTDLPPRRELDAWEEARAVGPALACVPGSVVDELGPSESLQRRYVVQRSSSSAAGPYAAEVRENVLSFTDPASAKAALTTVIARLRSNCAAPDLANTDPLESGTISGPGEGRWELYARTADKVCTECDAAYFDREAAIRVGDRLVLVSLSELGGPLQPKGLRTSMRRLTTRAANLAAE
jgi:hypothetical protein